MSTIKSITLTIVTLPWDSTESAFLIISVIMNIIYVGNNFVFGWYEYRWNIQWFITRVFGLDADLKDNLRVYYWLKGQGQLFTLFGIILATCGMLIIQGNVVWWVMGAITVWFIYTAYLDIFFKYELWKVLMSNSCVSFGLFNFMLFWFIYGEGSCNESKPNHCYEMSDGLRLNVYVFFVIGEVVLIMFFVNLIRWRIYFNGRIKKVFATLYQYKKKHLLKIGLNVSSISESSNRKSSDQSMEPRSP